MTQEMSVEQAGVVFRLRGGRLGERAESPSWDQILDHYDLSRESPNHKLAVCTIHREMKAAHPDLHAALQAAFGHP